MKIKLTIVFLIAFLLRIALIPVAHHGDLNNNISWGEELLDRGVTGYYGSDKAEDWPYSAPNQPPLYVYLFGGVVQTYRSIDSISRNLNESVGIFPSSFVWYWEESGMDLLAKMPGILADLGIGYLIYLYFARSRQLKRSTLKKNTVEGSQDSLVDSALQNDKTGIVLVSIWLFNPITWYNSAIWGQTDPIVNFLGLLAVFGLMSTFAIAKKTGRLQWFSFWITIAFLFKPSLSIFVPILAIYIIRSKFTLRDYFKAAAISFSTIALVSFWFNPYINFIPWIVDLYTNRILPGEIGYLTANAFNLWWLVDSGKVLDSTLYLGVSARIWGLIIGIGGIGRVCWWFFNKNRDSRVANAPQIDRLVFIALALSAVISFLFLTRIHERYLYPFFPYATLLVGLFPKYWIPYIVFSATYLLNMYHMFWAPPFPWLEANLTSFGSTLAVVNIVSFIYLFRHLRKSKI